MPKQKKSLPISYLLLFVVLVLPRDLVAGQAESGLLTTEQGTAGNRTDYEEYIKKYTVLNPPACTTPVIQGQTTKPHTIRIVGFDGVGWPLLNVLLQKQELPNIQSILCKGAGAVLKTDYADSPVSWTTIATGKSMEKHGILTIRMTGRSPFEYSKDAVRKPRLWDILRYHKIPTAIGKYYFTEEGLNERYSMEDQCRLVVEDIERVADDYYITIVEATDRHCHESLLAFLMKETAWLQEIKIAPNWAQWIDKNAAALRAALIAMDRTVGVLLDRHPEDTLVIVSDHGATVRDPYVRLCPNFTNLFPDSTMKIEAESQIVQLGSGLQLRIKMLEKHYLLARDESGANNFIIRAIVPRITIENREATSESEVASLTEKLLSFEVGGIRILIRDETGGVQINPELLEKYLMNGFHDPQIRDATVFGDHDRTEHGILLAYGPNIRAGISAEPCDLVDVVPTILYLAGLPIGKDLEGRVVTSIIRDDFLRLHPMEFIPSYDDLIPINYTPDARDTMSEEQKAKYRKLGYPGVE